MERADGCCEECHRPPDFRGLVPHHIKLKGMGGSKLLDYEDNLIVLCGKCHSARHGLHEV